MNPALFLSYLFALAPVLVGAPLAIWALVRISSARTNGGRTR